VEGVLETAPATVFAAAAVIAQIGVVHLFDPFGFRRGGGSFDWLIPFDTILSISLTAAKLIPVWMPSFAGAQKNRYPHI
jgi:hypothetical protein